MDKKEVSATLPASNKANTTGEDLAATVYVNYGENLDEAVQLFGEDQILSNAWANWRVTLQAAVRRMLAAGKSTDEIQAALENSKMGVAMEKTSVDPITASLMKFKTMTQEEQSVFLEKLKAAAASAYKAGLAFSPPPWEGATGPAPSQNFYLNW